MQGDRARVHEVAEVLELHERLDERLLELGPERMDRLRRRGVGQLEDLADRSREEVRGLGRLHQGERGLLPALPHERDELVRGKDEAPDHRGRRDQGEGDLQLGWHRVPPAFPG